MTEEMCYILYHGTNKKAAYNILKYGFDQYTYFSKNMHNALRYGGSYIFEVMFPRSYAPKWFENELCWQIRCREIISPDKIVGLHKITTKTLTDNKKLRDEIFKRTLPYYERGSIND